MRRWIALVIAWGICLAGWLVVSQIPNSFESRARVFVQLRQILPGDGATQANQQRDIDRIRNTLASAVNLEKVVRGTDMASSVSSPRDVADRVAGLQAAIKVVATQDNVFEISATSRSGKLARQIVQKLIDIFVENNLADDRDQTGQTLHFLDAQIDARQKALQDADIKRANFQTQYLSTLPGTGSLNDRLQAARDQLAQVNSDLAAAQSSLAAVNGQMAGTSATVAGAAGTSSLGPARARLAAIQGQMADARAKGYTDSHPDMIALRSQLAQAQAAASHEPLVSAGGGATSNPLYLSLRAMQADKGAQVAALTQRKAQIESDLNKLNAKLNESPDVASEQAQIDRDYQVLKDEYNKLLQQREQVRIQSQAQDQTDAVKFSVVDPPTQPRVPTAPNRPLLLTGVLIVGLGGGIAAAFALSKLNTSFATARALERASGMPVIGSIGEVVSATELAARRGRTRLFVGGMAALGCAYVAMLSLEFIQRGLSA
jgi:polysaccharide chain length determinant protein (PEP-CTERM system associated)